MNKILTFAVLALTSFGLAACSDNVGLQQRTADNRLNMAQGGSVEVKPGDTIYSIARRHNVAMSEIIKENKLTQPYVLQPGQSIRVPGVGYADNTGVIDTGVKAADYTNSRTVEGVDLGGSTSPSVQPVETSSLTPLDATPLSPLPVQGEGKHEMILTPTGPVTTPKPGEVQVPGQPMGQPTVSESSKVTVPETDVAVPSTQNVPAAVPAAAAPAKGTFSWPINGKASGSGNALDINAPRGTAVTSTAGGTVVSATSDSVTIQHPGGYTSTYSPLERVLVDKDAIVAKGDAIGTVGGSGKAAQLHFTIAKDGQPVDPQAALPVK